MAYRATPCFPVTLSKRTLFRSFFILSLLIGLVMFPWTDYFYVQLKPKNNSEKRWSDIATKYHSYVNTVQLKCNVILRIGHYFDGGWDICNDDPYKLKEPCLVYSFGIKDDWSFDDEISRKYGCHVHAFDPSIEDKDHNRSALIHFHHLGIGSVDSSVVYWPVKTLGSIQRHLGHSQNQLDVLKMDVERNELAVIPEMITNGSLNNVKQFVFEIHISGTSSREPDVSRYEIGLRLLLQLYSEGFRIFNTHRNGYCKFKSRFGPTRYSCHELSMVRVY